MTSVISIDPGAELGGGTGAEIAAGARAGSALSAGARTGQGSGQGGIRLGTSGGNSDLKAGSGAQSFRANWQSMVNGWGTGEGTSSAAGTEDASEGGLASAQSGRSGQVGRFGAQAAALAPDAKKTLHSNSVGQQSEAASDATPRLLAGIDARRNAAGSDGESAGAFEIDSAAGKTSDAGTDTRASRHGNTGKRQEAAPGTNAALETAALVSGLAQSAALSSGVHVLMPAAAMPERAAESLAEPSSSLGTVQETAHDAGATTDSARARKGASIGAAQAGIPAGARSGGIGGQTTNSLASLQEENEVSGAEAESQLDSLQPVAGYFGSAREASAETSQHGSAPREMSGSRVAESAPEGNDSELRGVDWSNSAPAESVANEAAAGALGSVGSGQTAEQPAARGPRREFAGESSQAGAHVAQVQPIGASVDAAAMVRDQAGVHAGASRAAGQSIAPAAAQPRTAQGTFAAMDANSGVGTPGWIHAGSRQAEAGFQDPALGWVGVRADLSGGGVHASLLPGSAEAAQALSGHLAGLNTYLAEQHTPVATLTMEAPHGNAAENGSGQGAGQGTGQGMGQGMNPGAGQDSERNAAAESQSSSAPDAVRISDLRNSEVATESRGIDGLTLTGDQRGTHISVMA